MTQLILLLISAALVNNVVLSRFLGLCPFLGVSKKTETSVGMGAAVIFVITLSSMAASLIYAHILIPLHLEYLQTIVFILVIAALVQFVEMVYTCLLLQPTVQCSVWHLTMLQKSIILHRAWYMV